MTTKVFLLCVFLLSGCATGTIEEDSGAPEDSGQDAWISETHSCQIETLPTDMWNCGECGNVCEFDDADSCNLGKCMCGLNQACEPGSDCRYGACIQSDTTGKVCEFDGECLASFECIEGRCTFVHCAEEECDGFDNDCDGTTDEGPSGQPLSSWCYSGPDIQDIIPPCHAGVQICTEGSWTDCLNELAPLPEQGLLACNGTDDACTGCPDGVPVDGYCQHVEPTAFDILYLIDVSGSMGSTIAAVSAATDAFSGNFVNDPSFKFALVVFPVEDELNGYRIVNDFSDVATIQTNLVNLLSNGGSDEQNWDMVHAAGTGALPVSWREGSVRVIVEFTDEFGQSYEVPPTTEQSMCESLQHGEVMAFFTAAVVGADFDECGVRFDLDDAITMRVQLEELIQDPCR